MDAYRREAQEWLNASLEFARAGDAAMADAAYNLSDFLLWLAHDCKPSEEILQELETALVASLGSESYWE